MRYEVRQIAAAEALERTRGAGDYRRCACPICDDPSPNAFWIHVPTSFFGCWSCGTKGRLPGADDDDVSEPPPPEEVDRSLLEAPEGFMPLTEDDDGLQPARRYVASRGITRRIAAEAGLGACLEGKHRGRVVVPVLDTAGKWVGFQARLYRKARTFEIEGRPYTEPRYKNPKGPWRAEVLWNAAALQLETDDCCIGVEGTFDGLPYWPDAFGFLGKPLRTQTPLVLQARRPVCIVLDGDSWEQAQMYAAMLQMEGLQRVGFVRLPPATDPNQARDWLRDEANRSIGKSLF